ncbi:DUF4166 domain-containing protein [Arthrobacter tecti]
MTLSIYQLALGEEFSRLQPQLQDYFSFHQRSGAHAICSGTFDVAGSPSRIMRPLFALAARENTFFPEYEGNVQFRVRNWAHMDPFGRPSLTARRDFHFKAAHRVFEDTTSWTGDVLVDYLGVHRRMATALTCQVTTTGRMRMVSWNTRLFAGPLRLPIPEFVGAKAYVEQWWDAAENCFRISSNVLHRQLGPVLVYAGRFTYETSPYNGDLPAEEAPARWERRV